MRLINTMGDVLLGLLGAGMAYAVYHWSGSGVWTIAAIAAYSALFVWFRAREPT